MTIQRSKEDRILTGVCGGIGKHFDIDPLVVRIIVAVCAIPMTVVVGALYIAAYLFLPLEGSSQTGADYLYKRYDSLRSRRGGGEPQDQFRSDM